MPEQYERITPLQKRFLLKAIEDETVRQTSLMQSAVELAIANVHRKRGKRRRELWKRIRSAEDAESPVSRKQFAALKAAFAKK